MVSCHSENSRILKDPLKDTDLEIDTRSLSVALDGGHYKKASAVWSLKVILQAKGKDPQTSCEGKCCRQISLRVSLNKPAIYKMKEGNR